MECANLVRVEAAVHSEFVQEADRISVEGVRFVFHAPRRIHISILHVSDFRFGDKSAIGDAARNKDFV